MNQNETTSTQKLAIAGVLTAAAVAGSLISVPVAGSKCAPVQHMLNVFSAVILGPWRRWNQLRWLLRTDNV